MDPVTTEDHRLSTTLIPSAYRLELAPDLASSTFAGQVAISLEIREATSEITAHAAELEIKAAHLIGADGTTLEPESLTFDDAEERFTLHFGSELPRGDATLELAFSGILNDQLRGFYRSTFTDADGAERAIATTQMEATDARRAFPCWDEPERKATFEVSLVVDGDLAAFSNSPEIGSEPLEDGRRRVRFAPTMVMSTYLVAFVVGPLVATDPVDVDGTPLRIIHRPGEEHLTSFALDVGAHALRFFTNYFGIPYPAEKLDMAAIPDFAFGAMENLGLVTYRETLLLVDPDQAAQSELQRVVDVICHEIAHMWFGDLVTMKWWNGIWLNEAFATFMETLACDAYEPEWERWVSFGVEREAALAIDGLHATRPVEYPVGRPEEAQGMFDVLTYEKGGSVLRMLEQYLGAETFRAGIHDYLTAHAYGNTETADLWSALERASGQPVGAIMGTWIDQGGYPLVLESPDGVATQEPFSYQGAPGGAIGADWQIPLLTRSLDRPDDRTPQLLGSEDLTLDTAETIILNAGGSGYYRVTYRSETMETLSRSLGKLSTLERFNLVSDTWAAALSGHGTVVDFIRLVHSLGEFGERDPSIWRIVLGAFGLFDRIIPEADRHTLAEAVRRMARPVLADLGWDPASGEGERIPALRAEIISVLGTIGEDRDVRAEARRRFDNRADAPLNADTEGAILAVIGTQGSRGDFESVLARYHAPANPQQELRYLTALAGFDNPDLAGEAFRLAATEVRTQNAPFLIMALLANRSHGPEAWNRLTVSWSDLQAKLPSNIFPRMLDAVRTLCGTPGLADEVIAFLEAHPLPAGGRTVEQAMERLRGNVAFGQRERERLAGTLMATWPPGS